MNKPTTLVPLAVAFTVLLVACLAPNAQAQIGTPVDIGSNQAALATSLAITTTQAVPAGASIIVIAEASINFGPEATGATCSDSAGNTYSTDVSENAGTSNFSSICSTHGIASQLAAGSTVTVSWSGTAPGGQNFLMHAFSVTGLAGGPADQTVSTAGTGSSASSGATATTTQAKELLFGAFLDTGSTVSTAGFTPGTNGTSNSCAATGNSTYTSLGGVDSGNPPSLFGAYCAVSAVGAYAASATVTGNPFWQALVATYKASTPRHVATTGSDTSNDCSVSASPCETIGHAVSESNAGDTLNVAAGTYTENITVSQSVTIQGSLTGSTIVNGNNAGTVFTIGSGLTVALNNLTISNGTAGSGTSYEGGGLYTLGSVTVSNCAFTGNSASNFGGGIYNAATLTVTSSTFSGNTTANNGGGIYNYGGTLTVTSSTFSANSVRAGGGIYNFDNGTLTVTSSTFSANSASEGGGGILNYGSTLTVANSVFSGNSAAGGAGIYSDSGTANASYNVFYHNFDPGTTEDDCYGCTTNSNATTDADPMLATLGLYGGPTQTMLPLPGSAAICAGSSTLVPGGITTDQRGFPRLNSSYGISNCVDAGAVQTNYQSVQFALAGYTGIVGATVNTPDPPVVTVTENGQNTGSVPVLLGFSGNGAASGLGPLTTAANTGAEFSSLSVNAAGSSDTLSVTLGITSSNSVTISASATLDILPGSTITTINSHLPGSSVVGQPVTVSYTVAPVAPAVGTPTGNVTVSDGTGDTCMASVAAGQCSLAITTAGSPTLTATYAGDSNFTGSVSSGVLQMVSQAASTTVITTHTPNPAVYGQTVTINFTVAANAPATGTPTGNVTVSDGTGDTCMASVAAGQCSLTITTAGTKTLTATYPGDSNFTGSVSGGALQTVNQDATITVITTHTPNPAVYGQTVTVNFTVAANAPGSGTPTGNVTVSDGASDTCAASVAAGQCSLTITTTGSKTLTATYPGDSNFTGSVSGGALQTVNQDATTTVITTNTPNPAVYRQTVTVNFTVAANAPGSGTPTGNVTVSDGASDTCAASVAAGQCSLTITTAGSKTLTATYPGDSNFTGSVSSGALQTVNPAPLTITASSGTMTYGGTVPAITPGYSGFVGPDSAASLTTAPTCSTTATSSSPVSSSPYPSSCSGAVDTNYTFNYVAGTVTVGKAPLTITASSTSMTYGGTPPAVTAGYSAFAGTDTVASLSPAPTCSTTATSSTPAGTDTGANSCSGAVDPNYTFTYVAGNVTINKATPMISLLPSANPSLVFSPLTFTATVSSAASTPTGNLSFSDGIVQLSLGALTAGVATYTSSIFTVGTHFITATYSGDANFLGVTSTTVAEQINPVTPTISWSPAAGVTYGTTLSGLLNALALNGTSQVAGSFAYTATPSGGSASPVTNATELVVGSYTLTATFTPTDTTDYKPASASVAFAVTKAHPTISLVSSLNPVLTTNPVTLTATVSSPASTPTGTVSFYDGTNLISTGTLTAGGVATYTSSSLTIGTHSFTVIYSGDANFASVTSSVVAQLVEDFTLNVSPAPAGTASPVLYPGSTVTYVFGVNPANGVNFPSAVTFALSGLPPGSTGTLTPSSLAAGAAGTNITLVITLANQILAHNTANPLGRGLALAMVGGIFLLPFGRRMRRSAGRAGRWAGPLLLMLAITCATVGLTACGGTSSGYFGQQPVNYTVTITATSGALSHSTTVTVAVQ